MIHFMFTVESEYTTNKSGLFIIKTCYYYYFGVFITIIYYKYYY